jgi:hypothetical protein
VEKNCPDEEEVTTPALKRHPSLKRRGVFKETYL